MGKGQRRERQAAELYEQAGYETFRAPNAKFNHGDMFGAFDIVCAKPDVLPRLVQVSTNANGRKQWIRDARFYQQCGFAVDYLQVYKNEGWRLFQPRVEEGWTDPVDERAENLKMGEGVVRYLSE